MSDEQWLPVHGLAGRYEVSSLGRVRSLDRTDLAGRPRVGQVLKPYRDGKKGYVAVSIEGCRRKVHRLVAAAFHGSPWEGAQVNHLNGERADNRSANLEWCTGSQNVQHSFGVLGRRSCGGHPGKYGDAHHASKVVFGRRRGSDDEWRRFGSANQAARELGLRRESISRAASGRYQHTGGWQFQWEIS